MVIKATALSDLAKAQHSKFTIVNRTSSLFTYDRVIRKIRIITGIKMILALEEPRRRAPKVMLKHSNVRETSKVVVINSRRRLQLWKVNRLWL